MARLGLLRSLFVPLLMASASAFAASTTIVTVPAKTWTDLGVGPLAVEVDDRSSQVRFAISDQMPATTAAAFLNLRSFQTTSHVWAYSPTVAGVVVAPLSSAAGSSSPAATTTAATSPVPLASGTGGTFGDTLGTSVTSGFIPPPPGPPYKSITITNQAERNSGITETVCPMGVKDRQGNIITPATDARGCYTFGPKGNYSAQAGGYVPQDGFNALASAPGTPTTIELH